ncbi:bifunctional riboflavin kinase/FMN adenylyltransferase [Planctomycetaceae bacterium SCGC AG-212-F19]|nr:bifunctional riboflavin kinase/FMN adenylyltransferase [Planctomycetaceae bacterium SCGC AG-212-F19]
MAIFTLDWEQAPPPECRAGALSIGNFDGVHRGHAGLLTALRREASRVGGPAVALTFDPHPLQLLRPDRFQPVLTTVADRAALLQEHADHVIVLRTTMDLLHLTADDFFQRVIHNSLAARAVVEGPNFGFGRDRGGTVETLAGLCGQGGIAFAVVPVLEYEGTTVSSSRVRAVLLRGQVWEAGTLLGRPYRLRGRVGVGQKRGRTIGFPTANLEQFPTLVPGDGVYAVRVQLPTDGAAGKAAPWPAAANIGPNPTFGENARKVEVHLIGFQGDVYGQSMAVDFVERLRDTRPFADVNELVAQLRKDVDRARLLVEGPGKPIA